jgi:tRNA 2-thiouridine synthesizing protein D
MKLGFMINTAPYTFENTNTVLRLIRAALAKGHECSLFLFMDGIVNANKDMKSPGEKSIAEELTELAAQGVAISICGECAKYRGQKRDAVIEGARHAGIGALGEMIGKSDRFLAFGF